MIILRRLIIFLRPFLGLCLALLLSSIANAQDHSNHSSPEVEITESNSDSEQPEEVGHQHHAEHSGSEPMQKNSDEKGVLHSIQHDMVMDDTANMDMAGQNPESRDPHAYSGGYTRSSGPYSLPPEQQLRLADEATLGGFWFDRLESRNGGAENFQELSGFAWLGNSYQRFLVRTELQWRDQTIEESQSEVLYSRAISRLWNIEAGARFDTGDAEHREWFALGIAGLAPYWFEMRAMAYVSPEGHSGATLEAEYDLLLSQRLILQPRAEVDFYGDSDLDAGHGKGLSRSVLGVRLRYEFSRQFAPYLGYERVQHHGEAARVFQPFGQHNEEQWVAGLKFWF